MKSNARDSDLEPDDDAPVGRVLGRRALSPPRALLGRRDILGLCGLAGAALLLGCGGGGADGGTSDDTTDTGGGGGGGAGTTCVVTPAATEGPFFVDELLNRSDIRSDPASGVVQAGVLVSLTLTAQRILGTTCTPIVGATVDLWHANAGGLYSDEASNGTAGQRFLRGYQVSDAAGQVTFLTIYPGWYRGRTIHMHFKVRTASEEFTSQLFFNDALSDVILAQAPYAGRGTRDQTNASDGIYGQTGSALLVALSASGAGYTGAFDIAFA